MSDVLIVGGGFAAVWSAAAAARRRYEAGLGPEDLTISLVAPSDDMVIRPRLYERRPGDMRVPLRRILAPIDVRRVQATAGAIDVERRQVVTFDADGTRGVEQFERLIVAAGSRLSRQRLTFPGAERFHDVDTLAAAVRLDEHLHGLPSRAVDEGRYTAVIVGAGFVGLEVATELTDRLAEIAGSADRVRVVLVEREDVVGPELGPGPLPVIEDALDELGVERRLKTTVTAFDGRAVMLSDGSTIPALTAVWSAGMEANPITAFIPGPRDELGRLEVDRHMRVLGVEPVFAAGDTASIEAEPAHRVLQACQYAHQLGKPAGHNAVSDLLDLPMVEFEPDPYVTCLDLGAAGAVYTEGFDRAVRATGDTGKDIKNTINRTLIYPPLDDAGKILERADHRTESRPPRPVERDPAAAR
jgi:NADH:quinone reductase (non-electrogenic)